MALFKAPAEGRSTLKYHVRDTFYDALSGEFQPPTDPDKMHTLGRLARATYRKGDENKDAVRTFPGRVFYYEPKWAAGVTVTTGCEFIEGTESLRMSLLSLVCGEEGITFMNATSEEEEPGLVILEEDGGAKEYSLELGLLLVEAKLAVTGLAQKFFESVPLH